MRIEGKAVEVYIPNTGRLPLLVPGTKVRLEPGKGKLPWRLSGMRYKGKWVSIDATIVNGLFERWVEEGRIFKGWKILAGEWEYEGKRFDFLLGRGREKMLVEVKSCTLERNGIALFPDAPTLRGREHLERLIEWVGEGKRGCMVFVTSLPGIRGFMPHDETDPEFGRLFREFLSEGGEAYLALFSWSGTLKEFLEVSCV